MLVMELPSPLFPGLNIFCLFIEPPKGNVIIDVSVWSYRLLRNRVSAQQARERKKAYLCESEVRVKDIEKKNSELEERLSMLQNENQMLRHVRISVLLLPFLVSFMNMTNIPFLKIKSSSFSNLGFVSCIHVMDRIV